MKILQLNCVYNFGSTGKIVKDIHEGLLKNNIDSYVYYARGRKINDQNVSKLSFETIAKIQSLLSKITGYIYGCSLYTTWKFKKAIKKTKPDIVHLQCINANSVNIYSTLEYLHSQNIPTVITFHAEFMYTGFCSHAYDCNKWKTGCIKCPIKVPNKISFFTNRSEYYWKLWRKIYSEFNDLSIVCVSEWLKNRVEQSPIITTNNISVIYNGVNTKVFKDYSTDEKNKIIDKYKITKPKNIIFVTSLFNDPNKGSNFILEIAKKFQKTHQDIGFILVGSNLNSIKENIISIKFTENQEELAILYSISDLTILASKKETFSMICAESLCCGTPIVGFESGAPELTFLPQYSFFSEYGDISTLEDNILKNISMKSEIDIEILIESAKKLYSKETMLDNYVNLYKQII